METLESGCVDASESPWTREEEEGEVSMAGVWRVWRDGGRSWCLRSFQNTCIYIHYFNHPPCRVSLQIFMTQKYKNQLQLAAKNNIAVMSLHIPAVHNNLS